MPLPVAAAHFPAELQALRSTSFTSSDATNGQQEDASDNIPASIEFVAQKLVAESNVQATLRAAAAKAKQAHATLLPRLKAAMESRSGNLNSGGSGLMLRQVKSRINLDFTVSPRGASSFAIVHHSLQEPSFPSILESNRTTDHELAVQARVTQIRDSLKPAWPSVPESRPPTPPPLPPTRLPKLTSKPPASAHVDDLHDQGLHVKFSVSTSKQTVSGVRNEPERISSRVSPRKSNVLAAGKARRSSAFARRKSLAFDQYEVDRVCPCQFHEALV